MAWKDQFQDKDGNCSVFLEVIVNKSTWFFHAFFALIWRKNDINVLDCNLLVANMLRGDDILRKWTNIS